jgi:hypothetical protein
MPAPPNRDSPHLLVSGGPFEGTLLPFGGPEGELLLGSGPECHLRLELADVSPVHARLAWNASGVYVHDAGSPAETYVNGERLQAPWRVSNGDRVFLGTPGSPGGAKLLVRLPGPPANYPAPADLSAQAPAGDDMLQYGTEDEVDERRAAEPPVAKPRKPTAEDFATQPTMIGERPRRTSSVPAMGPRPLPTKPPASRALLVGVGAAVLAAGGFFAYSRLQAPGPVVLSLMPPLAEPGHTVQIGGTGFEPRPESNQVRFGDQPAQVTSASDTQLSVVVPAGLATGEGQQHPVRVTSRGRTSSALFFKVYLGPKVTALDPDVAQPGDLVRAAGENLAEVSSVAVAGQPAEIVEAQAASLSFRVPPIAASPARWVPVQVQAGATSARLTHLLIGRPPLVLEVVPPRGAPGTRVTLKGRGFDPEPLRNTVRFGGRPALVLSSTPTEAAVLVPLAGPLSGQAEVEIGLATMGAASTGPARFTIARPSAATFVPRFVAEPDAGADRVVIATELGALLRLASPAASLSTAERGAATAEALNRLIQGAARDRPRLEVRQAPSLGVAVAGTPGLLVAVTAEDAAAYAAGTRPSALFLARYWAALIEDHVDLFALRQRPYRILDLGGRAGALLDLFAKAERQAEGGGVPVSAVAGLSAASRRELTEMAFALPAEGAGGGGAVVGRWEGSIEAPGRAPQRIQVTIARADRGLEGTLSTRSGKVSGELALEGLQYQAGTLRFGVGLGGTPLRFNGRLDGRTIAGSVERADGQAGGRFTLRWVE